MGSLADMAERKKSLADMASQRPESTIFSLADEWLDEPFESPPSVEQQAKDAFALSAQRGIPLDQSESVLSKLTQRTALEKQAGEIEKRKAERGVKMEPGAAFKEAFIQSMSDKPAMMLRGVQVYTPGRAYGMDDMAEKAATYLRARQDPEVQKRVQERAAGKLWPVAEGAKWYNVERQYLPEVINSWATHVGDQIPILLSVVGGKLLGRAAGKVAGPVAGAASALITGGPDPTDLATAPLVAKGASWLVEQIGGAAPLVAMEAGAFLDDAEALGIDRDLAEHYARLYGLGSGAIEYVQDLWVLDAYKRVPLGSRAKVMRAVLSEILGSAGEFGAEVSQEGLERHLLGKAVEQMKERNPDFKAEVPGIFEGWKRTGSIAAGVYFVTRLPGHGLSMARGRMARQSMVQARMGEWSEVSFDDEDQAQDFAEQMFARAQEEGMDVQLERQNEKVKYRMVPKAAESTAEAAKPPAEIGPGGTGFTPTFQPEVPIIEEPSDVRAEVEPPIRREAAPAVAEEAPAPAAAQAPAEAAEEVTERLEPAPPTPDQLRNLYLRIRDLSRAGIVRIKETNYGDVYYVPSYPQYGKNLRAFMGMRELWDALAETGELPSDLTTPITTPETQAEEVTQRQAWEMTREEAQRQMLSEVTAKGRKKTITPAQAYVIAEGHKAAVEKAVADNKPVPRAVLEEYKGEPWADAALAKLGETGTPATGQEGAGGIFDRAAGGKTGWTASYTTGDFGTERWVTVKDAEGNVIGQRDPFWNRGIPKSEKERQARIRRVAKEIVEDYDAKIMQRAGTEIGPEPQSQGGQPQQAGPAQPELRPSGLPVTATIFNTPRERFRGYAWRMMGRAEYDKLMAGQKQYGGKPGQVPGRGNFLAPTPESAAQYKTKGKVLVEFGGVEKTGGETVSNIIGRDNVTAATEWTGSEWRSLQPSPSPSQKATAVSDKGKAAVGRDLPTSTDVTGNDFSTEPITKAEKDQLRELGWSVSDIAKADPAKLREFLSLHEQNRRQGGFLRIHFGRNETVEQKVERAIADLKRQLGESQRPMERTEAEDPDAPVRERQFVTRLKEMEILGPETTAEYHVRDTDALAIKAANLVREDIERAERMARTGTDDNAVAVACELLKHYHRQALATADEAVRNTLYDKISEVAHDSAANLTELGRAVQAASILAMQTPEGMARFAARTIEKYNASHKNRPIPNLTSEQIKYITQRIAEIQAMPDGMEKAVEFQKLMDYVRGLVPATVLDKILTLWKAGLLTGIKTSGLNTASNLMHGISEVAKDIPAVAVDSVLSLITGKRTLAFTVAGTEQGLAKGVKAGWMYVKTGFSERDIAAKLDWKRVNFGKSKVAKALQAYEEFVFRILGAEDQPFYYGAKARSIAGQAIAMAKNENLTGDALRARAQEIAENPTDEMLRYAVIDAETAVFQNRTKLGDAAAALQRIPGAGFIIPFGRTPSAIAMQILNYSPVGAVKAIAENMTNFDQRLFSQEMGRAALGTGVLWLGAMLFRAGLMTLDRPKTDREEEFWNVEGRSANSIKIGGKWRSVQVLGPVGSVLVVGGHFAQALDETGSPTRAIVAAASGGGKSFTEQTYLRGMNEAMRAIGDLDRSWNGFVSSLAGSVVPTLVADIARANDSVERRTSGPVERIVSRVPVARETLEPRINVFGQDLPRYGGNVLEVMADPTRPAKINQDVVVDELRRLWDTGLAVSPTLLGNRDGYDVLTKSQNTELWRRAGEITYVNLFGTMQSPMYAGEDDDGKAKLIERAVEEAKIIARTEMAYSLLAGLTPDVRMVKMMEMRKSKLITNDVARELERLL